MLDQAQPMDEHLGFEALYCAHSDAIYRFCLRLCGNPTLAEDLTQEVFVGALQGFHRLKNRSSAKTWLYRVALYRVRAHRSRHESRNVSLEGAAEPRSVSADAQYAMRLDLSQALATLSPAQREAFLLVKCQGLTCSEAASVLRIPVGTVKFRVHRAVNSLQSVLSDTPEASHEM